MKLSTYSNLSYSHFSLYLCFIFSFLKLIHFNISGSYIWFFIGISLLISILFHSSNISNRKPYLNKNLINRLFIKVLLFFTSSILLYSSISFLVLIFSYIDNHINTNILLPLIFLSLITFGTLLGFYSRSTKL